MVIAWLKKFTRSGRNADRPVNPYMPQIAQPTFQNEVVIPQELIARRAYEKWVARGKPVGTSTQDWLEAEAELRAERRPNRNQ